MCIYTYIHIQAIQALRPFLKQPYKGMVFSVGTIPNFCTVPNPSTVRARCCRFGARLYPGALMWFLFGYDLFSA